MLRLLATTVVLLLAAGSLFAAVPADDKKVARYLKVPDITWVRHEDRHFVYFVESGSYGSNRIRELAERMHRNRATVLKTLGEDDVKMKPFAFFVSSRAKMKQLVGAEVNGLAVHASDAIFMVYSPTVDAVTPHELFHLYARKVWGTPKLELINEGMAVYSGGRWHQQPLHQLAAYLKVNRKLIPIDELFEDFSKHEDLVSYPQAGSFMTFLNDKYGTQTIKAVWNRDSPAAFRRAFKKSLSDLEKEWLLMLDSQDHSAIKYEVHAK
jgi:hypothetical protein